MAVVPRDLTETGSKKTDTPAPSDHRLCAGWVWVWDFYLRPSGFQVWVSAQGRATPSADGWVCAVSMSFLASIPLTPVDVRELGSLLPRQYQDHEDRDPKRSMPVAVCTVVMS